MINYLSLLPESAEGQRFILHRVDAAGDAMGAAANHNNIKLNPVFRGMPREKIFARF
ncbi:MAG: hypothetical protein ACLQSR_04030 [Limisphaerales bacterium]